MSKHVVINALSMFQLTCLMRRFSISLGITLLAFVERNWSTQSRVSSSTALGRQRCSSGCSHQMGGQQPIPNSLASTQITCSPSFFNGDHVLHKLGDDVVQKAFDFDLQGFSLKDVDLFSHQLSLRKRHDCWVC